MGDVSYTVRLMTSEDVPQTLDAYSESEYPGGTHCLYTWLQVDKEAFNIAVKDTGEVIGVCGAVIHHDDLAFLGTYAVRKKYRGLGIGKKLWDACLVHIGTKNAALNAVTDKTELYRTRGGFPILETERTAVINETFEDVNYESLSQEIPEGVDIQPFQESHLPAMFEYDISLMGYKRELALQLNCKEEDSKTVVAFKDNKCVGFGTIKMSYNGLGQVGPLYADESTVAEVMLRKLIISLPKAKGFAMMTINTNKPANEMIKKLGCPVIEECPRLYTKAKFDVDTNKVFAHFDLNYSPY